jgi:hypothetical protein
MDVYDALVRTGFFHPAGEILAEGFCGELDARLGAQLPTF